ncbi:MAG: hypothetical protein KGI37_10480 [Alphaproteobacteria bacterium]|nr:hypothetical protein [Alphaproteobacteria bacterium]
MKRTSANMMKARQTKAGRSLLDWKQKHLAHAAGLSIGTIRKIELGYISPRDKTMAQIKMAFERNGLELIEPGGVRYRTDTIITYLGSDGVVDFFDDMLQTTKKRNEEILTISRAESLFGFDSDADAESVEKLAAIKARAAIKCLLTEDSASPLMVTHSECRSLSKNYVDPGQCFIYGDKYAVFETVPTPKIIVIQSVSIAQSMRQQFHSIWDKATSFQAAAKPMKARSRR